MNDRSPEQVINTVHETLLWFFWPKLMRNGVFGPCMDFELIHEDEPVEIRDPESFPPLDAFVGAMKALKSSTDESACLDIECLRPRKLLGYLSLSRVLRRERVVLDTNDETPIILMGYYNPIYRYGTESFVDDALEAGVDGLIVVDLPAEEDDELCHPAMSRGLHWIRLATPTTDDERLPVVLSNTSGFVYYVSIAGVTGTRSAASADVGDAVARLKRHCDLPVAVGFGIRTSDQVRDIAAVADAAVVGSALVQAIADSLDSNDRATPDTADCVTRLVSDLSRGVRDR